ncbi:hypothetical protein FEM48_Zijuj08G0185900 [Ziziphus jujuba var. spinosa]|uniref:Bulb-type lectin domain-containing protein n=1 Tax=Ziziphus jujuba var. spinosa TaxID=714518 RepID=A0A978V0P8_ZIZJJ|nr:hypothetical protein FEM48_Zijuj08G0185900 [Ziziphus jujuba var. spinosa]
MKDIPLVMASVMLFLLASVFISVAAQQRESTIIPGSSLEPITNSTWSSNSGLYAFGFYKQGKGYTVGIFLAGIPQKTVVWTANRDGQPVSDNSTLLFTNDGKLVLQSSIESQDFNIGHPLQSASSASMLDSGNFVLYNSSGRVIWQSFDHPTDTLLPTQRLLEDQQLVSSVSETDHSTGIFRLKMQKDGNLVQYPINTPDAAPYSYYASWVLGKGPGVTLNLGIGCHIYMLDHTGFNVKNITEGETSPKEEICLLRIDADGIFRVYSHNRDSWSIEWVSSNNTCDPKGLCGINAFCHSNVGSANCTCIPGYKFVNKGNWTGGCEKSFSADGCGNNGSFTYVIQEQQDTTWLDSPYSTLTLLSKKDCAQACLEDCNCETAIYDPDGSCKKQKLPLQYGRSPGDKAIVLIKVATSRYNRSDGFVPKEEKKMLRVDILIIGVSLAAFGLIMCGDQGNNDLVDIMIPFIIHASEEPGTTKFMRAAPDCCGWKPEEPPAKGFEQMTGSQA